MATKNKEVKSNNEKYIYFLLIVLICVFVLLAFNLSNYESKNKEHPDNIEGSLNTLRWESEGVEVMISKKPEGGISLSLESDFMDIVKARESLIAIKSSVEQLIEEMKDNGWNVDENSFKIELFEDDKLLKLEFDKEMESIILNGTAIFLEHAGEYCNTTIIPDVIGKIKDSKVYDVNISSTDCSIIDIPFMVDTMDLSKMTVQISQTQDFSDQTVPANQNITPLLDLDDHFDYGGICTFEAGSTGDNILLEVNEKNELNFYPNKDFIGKDRINIKLICSSKELTDSFYIMVVNETSYSNPNEGSSNSGGGTGSEENSENLNSNNDSSVETTTGEFKILNPTPDKPFVPLNVNEEEVFSIDNQDYDSIEWHLDGVLTNYTENSYRFSSPTKDGFILRVLIKKGDQQDYKTWHILVKDIYTPPRESPQDSDGKSYIIILMIVVVILILVLIIILIIRRKKGDNNKMNNYRPIYTKFRPVNTKYNRFNNIRKK